MSEFFQYMSSIPFVKESVPVITFFLGFFSSRFTMTKKEKKDYKNALQENANKYSKELDEAFGVFTCALQKYVSCNSPTIEEFQAVSVSGELYFSAMKRICSAILEGNIPAYSIELDFCRSVKEFVEKNVQLYYSSLNEIAGKIGVSYHGVLIKENYGSVFKVYEKYCVK